MCDMDASTVSGNEETSSAPVVAHVPVPGEQTVVEREPEESAHIISTPTRPKTRTTADTNGHSQVDPRPRSSTDVSRLHRQPHSPMPCSPSSPGSSQPQHRGPGHMVRSKSHSLSSCSSEMLFEDSFPEDDNKTREREMWAMLAGQTAFKFQSYIFQRVLPSSLIKPHIFPRNVEDMETLIEKYTATGKSARLEGAAEKWATLKRQWKWRKAHGLVIGTAKSAYLHISNPLEVMMKLDREKGDSLEDARRAYRNVLPSNLQDSGKEVVDLMHMIGLLTDKTSPPSPR